MTQEIKTGDQIRSFDFEDRTLTGNNACYIEGMVENIERPPHGSCLCYKFKVTRKVFGGDEYPKEIGDIVYAPVNGTRKMFGGTCNGVKKI